MDKLLFSEVVKNCAATSSADAQQVINLRTQYPFSQVLQILSAKVSKDHDLTINQDLLTHAAVYSSDRTVLKAIMLGEVFQGVKSEAHATSVSDKSESTETQVQAEENIPAHPEAPAVVPQSVQSNNTDVADMLMQDLQKLSVSRHNFEMLFTDDSLLSLPDSVAIENENLKSKREKIIEIARGKNTDSTDPLQAPVRKKRSSPPDNIIEEIKVLKQELEPESERQKEQLQIIEQFIKVQPSISSAKDRNNLPPADLNSIKPGEFGENIISETLVEILVKQGKKERAIEVLKKLIWKYPQKKAYFASQIEDLKK